MRSFTNWISGAAAAAMVLALASTASATPARSGSLHGSLLIEDVTDSYFMPQLLLKYRNLLEITVDEGSSSNGSGGSGGTTGQGMFIFGTDSMALGIIANRGDNIDPTSGRRLTGNQLGSILNNASPGRVLSAFPKPATFIDAILSLSMGENAGLGFRLGFAHGSNTTDPAGGGDDSVTQSQTVILLGGGYSMSGALRLDLSLFASIALASDEVAKTSGNDINITINFRMFSEMAEKVELGVLGNIGLNFGGVSPDSGPGGTSTFGLNIAAGAGPRYLLDDASIAVYAFLSFGLRNNDPNIDADNDGSGTLKVVVPGIHGAMELDLTDWFHLRMGFEVAWVVSNGTAESDDAPKSGSITSSYGWSGGFGITFPGGVDLDFALQNSFFTTGPNFLGGGSGFAGTMSASKKF